MAENSMGLLPGPNDSRLCLVSQILYFNHCTVSKSGAKNRPKKAFHPRMVQGSAECIVVTSKCPVARLLTGVCESKGTATLESPPQRGRWLVKAASPSSRLHNSQTARPMGTVAAPQGWGLRYLVLSGSGPCLFHFFLPGVSLSFIYFLSLVSPTPRGNGPVQELVAATFIFYLSSPEGPICQTGNAESKVMFDHS